jgi:hypothetical protein
MSNPSAAYGIYTFKKGDNGRRLDLGDEATLQDYYLNAWKGNLVITVVGFDTEKKTLDGLETLASSVVEKVTASGSKPSLLTLLPEEHLDPSTVRYMRGNLALFNTHEFAKGNIFGVQEGLTAQIGDEVVFLFAYKSENEAKEWLVKAWNRLSEEKRYREVTAENGRFSAVDESGLHIEATTMDRFILLAMGDQPAETTAALELLRRTVSP